MAQLNRKGMEDVARIPSCFPVYQWNHLLGNTVYTSRVTRYQNILEVRDYFPVLGL